MQVHLAVLCRLHVNDSSLFVFYSYWRETLPFSSLTLSAIGMISRIFSWSSWWVFIFATEVVYSLWYRVRSPVFGGGGGKGSACVLRPFLTRGDTCKQGGGGWKGRFSGWEEVLFGLLGTCLPATHSHGFSRRWRERQAHSGAFVALTILQCHHGNCDHWLCPPFHPPFLGTMYHNQRGGSWGGEQEYFPLHLPTVDIHVVTRAAIMASLFCGHLTRVDQVWPGGHRSLSLDLLLQWSL